MNSHESEDEKKLHIDEDWKPRVEAEKERARAAQPPEESAPVGEEPPEPEESVEAAPLEMIPPASMAFLITSISTQALVALGEIPTEHGVHLGLARLHIDTLEVLQKKTKGNLTPDESAMLEGVLYQLRMAYVTAKER